MRARRQLPVAVLAAMAVLLVTAAATANAAISSSAMPAPPAVPAQVLQPVVPSTASVQSSAAWPAELDSALSAQALGPDVAGLVTDAGTGRVLYSRFSNRPQQPASTIKILTAITVLKAFGPDARLTTQVQFGATNRDIILRGGGDATLARVNSPEAGWPAGQGARPATLTDLASRTALSLHKAGISAVRLRFDDSLFVGTRLAPGWKPSFVAAGVVSPVTALSVDGGRVSAGSASRSLDPAQSAAEFFAARLRKLGISVASDVKRTDGSDTAAGAAGDLGPSPATSSVAGSKVLATVVSPPMADLVERLLTRSDDDLAEALGHLAGGKLAGSASFQGGVTATIDTLEQLGMSLRGTKLADASGLSSLNELDPETFTQALAAVVADKPFTGSNVGVLWPVSSGLPVAGVTGTLSDRFVTAKTSAGRGIVRAKTGTLTGVVGLAGIVLDAHGHLLIFDFDADRSPGPLEAARAAVDRAATLVASH